MRKIILFTLLSGLPFTQMASVLINRLPCMCKTAPAQPAPDLPLNVLTYFVQ